MRKEYIYLIVGPSGSGKSTIVDILKDKYGWQGVDSYTTRPPRFNGEGGHIFVGEDDFNALRTNMMAYTVFDGHQYGTTIDQIDNADVYIIDFAGVQYMIDKYKGKKTPIVVYLRANEMDLVRHMLARGDSEESIIERLRNDEIAFAGAENKLKAIPYDKLSVASNNTYTPQVIAKIIHEHREEMIQRGENDNCD